MKIEKLGLQLYTIRDTMQDAESIRKSFRNIKEMGYDVAQTAGCSIPWAEFGQIAKEEGIEICGTHDDFNLMVTDPKQAMENHRLLGTTNMGTGGFWPAGLADVEEFIEKANALANIIYDYGFKFTYHNHSHEFNKIGNCDKTVMDLLVEGLDPVKTSFVLDTCWVHNAGHDVRYWIEKLAGRVDILHLKEVGYQGHGMNNSFITEVGNGNLYWAGIIESAQKSGVKYYVVEQDTCPGDPFDSIRMSSEYLHKNFM